MSARPAFTPPLSVVQRYDGGIRLELHEPPSANRWWRHVGARVVLSREARAYQAGVSALLTAHRVRAIEGPVSVSVVWYRGRRSGDLDKRLGVLLDALQGTAYLNDSQVTDLHAARLDRPGQPGVVVTVVPRPVPAPPG